MAADLRALARRKARKYGLDPDVFERQIQQESGFNPRARSPAGALGVAQIMPATARGWKVNPLDPTAALDAAARNMAGYVRRYGGYENALRAYNAGPGAIEKSKRYRETNNYVRTILGGRTPKSTPPSTSSRGPGFPNAPGYTETSSQEEIDTDAYAKARRRQLLAKMFQDQGTGGALLKLGILSTADVDPMDFLRTSTTQRRVPGVSTSSPGGGSRSKRGPSSLLGAVRELEGLAGGLPITAKQEPGHATGGDHDPAVRGATARDFGGSEAARQKAFRRLAKRLGVPNAKYGQDLNVTKGNLRYQVISRPHGTGPHLHVGIRKVRRR